jgi:hypothetical protein
MNVSMAKKSQIDKFRETARALETDESEDKFDATLRKVAAAKPDPRALDELADIVGQKDPNSDFVPPRRALGADEGSDAFDSIVAEMARTKPADKKR